MSFNIASPSLATVFNFVFFSLGVVSGAFSTALVSF